MHGPFTGAPLNSHQYKRRAHSTNAANNRLNNWRRFLVCALDVTIFFWIRSSVRRGLFKLLKFCFSFQILELFKLICWSENLIEFAHDNKLFCVALCNIGRCHLARSETDSLSLCPRRLVDDCRSIAIKTFLWSYGCYATGVCAIEAKLGRRIFPIA